MLLSEYSARLAKIIEKYSKTDLIVASAFSIDYRTEKIGLIEGSVTFIDGSRLFFTECSEISIHTLKYALQGKLLRSSKCSECRSSRRLRQFPGLFLSPAACHSDSVTLTQSS